MSEEFNLEERVLCEDDNCIGLVGSDGKCKVCGRVYEGERPLPDAEAAVSPTDTPADDDGNEDARSEEDWENDGAEELESDPTDRVLCPDDTCVGIIGENGTCGTCGKSM